VSIPTNHIYLLNISKQGYLFFSENFNMVETFFPSHPYLKDIPLRPIKSGNKMVLKNVFFATDSFALKPESTLELQKVVSLMLSNPNIRIEVSGHTDDRGTAEHNQVLSENRALSVVKYLTDAGIQPSRMVAKGYGMKVPVLSNTTEEGRAQNRRTEITIIP
jgi:outer membrane protein OmpA-like peptidoglycan-associated protein